MRISTVFKIACFALPLIVLFAGRAERPGVRATIQVAEKRQPAPAFRLIDASGKAVQLSDYRRKPVLLNLWATECGGCIAEIPSFIELQQAYRDKGLAVVGLSMDIMYEDLKSAAEGWAKIRPFVTAHKVNYPILMGDDTTPGLFHAEALPATYLIDRKGLIAATYVGVVDASDLEANIKTVLAEP